MTQEEYQGYLQTPHWKLTRDAAVERAGHRCQVCNAAGDLEVHHRTYERIGCERPGDLTVLCDECHELFHERTKRLLPVATVQSAICTAFAEIDNRVGRESLVCAGIPSGWVELDHLTAGFSPSTLWAVCGRGSVGKTTFLTNFVCQVALEEKRPTLLLSTEAKDKDIAERILAAKSRVGTHRIRRGHLSSDDIQRLMNAGDTLRATPLFLSGTGRMTFLQLAATVREYHSNYGIQVVAVDGLDSIDPDNTREFRPDQIATISRGLKALAMELNVVILVTARMMLRSDDRIDHVPVMSELKHNWPIEHEADGVLKLHRPCRLDGLEDDTVLSVSLPKHRNGPTGEVTLTFIKEICRLENYIAESAVK